MSSVSDYNEEIYRNLHMPAVIIGGCFALAALTLSLLLTLRHLRSYTKPQEQKWVVAVIFMVPVYATESFISLSNPKSSVACDILRNFYEAFALYSFASYLVACTGGERSVIELLENESQKHLSKPLLEGADGNNRIQRSSFINFFWQPSVIGRDLFVTSRFGLVQYMILKTLCAFLAFLLGLFGVYGDGQFKWYYGYPYIVVVLNFSQVWALYCLVQFYHVTHERLKEIKPLAKFISFKAIVFATWWQGMGISVMSAFGVLPNEKRFGSELQDFLICIEMAIASVAHIFVFAAAPYDFVPAAEQGNVISETSKLELKLEQDDSAAMLEKTETHVEAPRTSITKSVQNVVVQGGQYVVKDVVLTLNEAIGPEEKGVTKIQETFHHRSPSSEKEDELKIEVEKQFEKNLATGEVKEHIEENVITGDEPRTRKTFYL